MERADTRPQGRPRLAALRALYVSYNMALGLSLPYLSPFLERAGLSGTIQGQLFALRTGASIAAQPVIGLAADRFGIGRGLRVATLLAFVAFGALLAARSMPAFVAVFLLLALGQSSIPVLLDAGTLAELESAHAVHGGASAFGRSRIFGSAAFAISALGFGLVFRGAASAVTAPAALLLIVAFSGASVAIALATPATHAGLSRPRAGDLRRLLALPGIPQILLAAALQWVAMSPYNLFFGAHVQHHGGDARTIGFSIGAAIVGEMLVMATAHRWLSRLAPRHVLAVSAAVGMLRWTATALGSPLVIILAQSLHAFSFAAFYLSMTDAMVRRTPAELRGSAQSLLTAGGSGIGSLLGGLFAGPLYSIDQGRTLFLAAGAFSLLPALAALAIPPLPRK